MSDNSIVGLGARTDHLAPRPNLDPAALQLTPDEILMFGTIGRVARIDEILQRCGMPEAKALACLLSLRAKGAIVPAKVKGGSTGPTAPLDAAMSENVEMEEERKREVLDLERDLDSKHHFQVLGLQAGASPEDVKKAFYELSRKFHPDRYYNKNLGSFRARIERLFKRVSEAHRVLTDPTKRAEYLKENPILARAPAPTASAGSPAEPPRARTVEDDARDAERRTRFGRHPYFARSRAIGDMVGRSKGHMAKGEFGKALADLNIAAQADPKNAEIQSLLLEARKGHDAFRAQEEFKKGKVAENAMDLSSAATAYKMAASIDVNSGEAAFLAAKWMSHTGGDIKEVKVFAQRAAELLPKNADAQALFGEVLMEVGMKKLALRYLELALELKPDHVEAKRHLKKAKWPF